MEKLELKMVSIVVLLIIGTFCLSQAGIYNVEVPEKITDEMFFGRSEYIDSKLMELVHRELEGKKEEIAVVVFTRDGDPIRQSFINDDLTLESTEIPRRNEPPQDNELEFVWVDNPPNTS